MSYPRQLLLAIIYYVLLIPMDSIAYIQWINALINYKWLASSIIFPLISILSFGSVTFYFKIKHKLHANNIDISQKKLFYIGILDSISTIVSTMCLPYMSIIITITLSKLAIPITMALSYFFLDKRFYWNHYLSLFVILIGVLLIIVPYLKNSAEINNPYALFFYTFSLFPTVISDMYKEKILKKKKDVNFYWMNTYISVWQLFIGIATTPIMILNLNYGYDNSIDFIDYVDKGLKCQLSLSNNMGCNKSLFWLFIYQFISTTTNTLSFTIIKYGSAMILLILTNIKLPLTYIFGYILINYNIINSTSIKQTELSMYNFISIILLIIGAFLYNYKLEYTKKTDSREEYLLGDL
jgi:drug/metabolite transporter (DMT)-like permease